MFKKIEKTAVAEFELCAKGPVVIADGKNNETDPRLPDKVFLSGHNGEEKAFVIPGSTIKGVIRGFVYDRKGEHFCEILFGQIAKKDTERSFKSKVSFHDAYADMRTISSAIRNSTAIDPVLQSASGNSLNNIQVVEKGLFKAGFRIVNYNDEELQILIAALKNVNSGLLRFGGRTSRGYGIMSIGRFNMKITDGFNDDLTENVIKTYTDFSECEKEVLIK